MTEELKKHYHVSIIGLCVAPTTHICEDLYEAKQIYEKLCILYPICSFAFSAKIGETETKFNDGTIIRIRECAGQCLYSELEAEPHAEQQTVLQSNSGLLLEK